MAVAPSTAARGSGSGEVASPRAPFLDKIWYGIGQFGEGIQQAITSLLLFFYTQVVGIDPILVGACILFGSLLEGFIDAFAGTWSDATKHKWGRRHPYLYYSAIPASLSMALLFMPPQGMGATLPVIWLFFWGAILRSSLSLYLIPHWALGVELSNNPSDRLDFVKSRIFFAFLGSGSLFLISILFFHGDKGAGGGALLERGPYLYLAIFIGIFALITKVGSALGTHKYIPRLPQAAPDAKPMSIAATIGEIRALFTYRPFVIFFFAASFVSLGLAVKFLDIYMGTYFWKLPSSLTLVLPGLSTVAFAVGTFFWASVAKRIGTKPAYMMGIGGSGLILVLLPMLKIYGLFPAEGSNLYFPTIVGLSMLGNLSAASGGVMAGTYLAIVSDGYERHNGRRSAGIITGFLMFIAMMGAAVAQQLTGVLVKVIGLTPGLKAADASTALTDRLGYAYGLTALISAAAFVAIFSRFPRLTINAAKT